MLHLTTEVTWTQRLDKSESTSFDFQSNCFVKTSPIDLFRAKKIVTQIVSKFFHLIYLFKLNVFGQENHYSNPTLLLFCCFEIEFDIFKPRKLTLNAFSIRFVLYQGNAQTGNSFYSKQKLFTEIIQLPIDIQYVFFSTVHFNFYFNLI